MLDNRKKKLGLFCNTKATKATKGLVTACVLAGSAALSMASRGDFTAGVGFMERSDTGYGFLKGDIVMYSDENFKHKLGLEFLGYRESLDKATDTDLIYSALVANYEVEIKANETFSYYLGGGGGAQFVDLDSPAGSLDDDVAGYAQVFAGVRARMKNNLVIQLGVRRMFFDDHELLGVTGLKQQQTWGMELGLKYTF